MTEGGSMVLAGLYCLIDSDMIVYLIRSGST